MTALRKLEKWYNSHCNEDWEHSYGIKIETLDNPGWKIEIDLSGTKLEKKGLEEISYGLSHISEPTEKEWLLCKVSDNQFFGVGDPFKLEEIINTFLNWVDTEPVAGGDGTR